MIPGIQAGQSEPRIYPVAVSGKSRESEPNLAASSVRGYTGSKNTFVLAYNKANSLTLSQRAR